MATFYFKCCIKWIKTTHWCLAYIIMPHVLVSINAFCFFSPLLYFWCAIIDVFDPKLANFYLFISIIKAKYNSFTCDIKMKRNLIDFK